jgi:hypothetical protein
MAASRRAIDEQHVRSVAGPFGRLALSKCEAADALGVSVDLL